MSLLFCCGERLFRYFLDLPPDVLRLELRLELPLVPELLAFEDPLRELPRLIDCEEEFDGLEDRLRDGVFTFAGGEELRPFCGL